MTTLAPCAATAVAAHREQADHLRDALGRLNRAEAIGHPYDMSAALATLARCYRRIEAFQAAEDSLRRALRWAFVSGGLDHAVDLLCELAETACLHAVHWRGHDELAAQHATERAREAAFDAARWARGVADAHWERTVLLRASDILNCCGDHDDAAWLQGMALAAAPATGGPAGA